MSSPDRRTYEFGPFCLDPSEGHLLREGKAVSLTPKAFEALVLLVERHGHLIEKEELLKTLWPDTFVEEANLAHHVWRLRKILEDSKDGERYIETIPKRGYRFIGPVKAVDNLAAEPIVEQHTITRFVAEREMDDDFTLSPRASMGWPGEASSKRWAISLRKLILIGSCITVLLATAAYLQLRRMRSGTAPVS